MLQGLPSDIFILDQNEMSFKLGSMDFATATLTNQSLAQILSLFIDFGTQVYRINKIYEFYKMTSLPNINSIKEFFTIVQENLWYLNNVALILYQKSSSIISIWIHLRRMMREFGLIYQIIFSGYHHMQLDHFSIQDCLHVLPCQIELIDTIYNMLQAD